MRPRLAGALHAAKLYPNDIEPNVTVLRDPTWLPKGAGMRAALTILRETGEAMTSRELAACILQRYGRPIEEGALNKLVSTLHSNFCRRRNGIVEFARNICPEKWRLKF